MLSSLSPGTRAIQPKPWSGLEEGVPDSEVGVQEDMRRAGTRAPQEGPAPFPHLSPSRRGRKIYFGVYEPVSPLPQGWDQAAQLLGDSPLGA